MRLGIYTPYCHCEETYAATSLAEWGERTGRTVSLYPQRPPRRLQPHWDDWLVDAKRQTFTKWAKQQDVVVWTGKPRKQQVGWVNNQQVKTVAVPFWHKLTSGDSAAYRACQHVVAPSRAAAVLMQRRWGLSQLRVVPWDTGWPLTTKDDTRHRGPPQVLVPLLDRTPGRLAFTLLHLVTRLLETTEAAFTIAYMSSQIAPAALRLLSRLQRRFDDRVRIRARPPLRERPFLLGSHDLVLWPLELVDVGLLALQATSMGTPVAAFAVPPLPEFLNSSNACLVPCDLEQTQIGVPIAIPDYEQLEHELHKLLGDASRLAELERGCSRGLLDRRNLFMDQWTEVLT